MLGGTIPSKRLRALIKAEAARHKAEQKSWPAVTDCDRLDEAFVSLERNDILALHNAGATASEGIDEMSERYHEAGGAASGIVGYCFYHRQDMEYALDYHELSLAFRDINGDRRKGVAIGRHVRGALEAAGLQVHRSGAIKDKLSIQNFHWQRRSKKR